MGKLDERIRSDKASKKMLLDFSSFPEHDDFPVTTNANFDV